jgi:DNA helicase-2/ATP-dependent DNA helicase PcrA
MPTITLEELWHVDDFKPNDAQRRAILHTDGPLYLPAGPGSGKTRVLLWRTLNLIVFHGVKPEEIFLSTFTEKAARQLKDEITIMLANAQKYTQEKYDTSRMYVGTVHSLCQQLIRDRRFAGRSSDLPAMLDDIDQYMLVSDQWTRLMTASGLDGEPATIFEEINTYLKMKKSRSRHDAISNCITFFNRCADEDIDVKGAIVHRQHADKPDHTLIALLKMCDMYRQILDEQSKVDFGSIQLKALTLLLNSAVARSQFKHVIIDEYQDTNPVQERIFFELARGHGNICVVGDDDQALYRFRGATVENFVMFKQSLQRSLNVQATEIALDINYRSHHKIVGLYNTYMRDTQHWTADGHLWRVRKTIKPNPNPAPDVSAQQDSVIQMMSGSPPQVTQQLAQFIKTLLDEGRVTNPNQIAVLFKSVKSTKAKQLIQALENVGLKAYAPRAGRFLEVEEAVDMLGVLMQFTGKPTTTWQLANGDFSEYMKWADETYKRGAILVQSDPFLKQYMDDRKQLIVARVHDRQILLDALASANIARDMQYDPDTSEGKRIKQVLLASAASAEALKPIRRKRFEEVARQRIRDGKPLVVNQLVARATTFDFGLMDLFYQIQGFDHFKAMIDKAQQPKSAQVDSVTKKPDVDEGPIINLGLVSRYLARFVDSQNSALLSARDFTDDSLLRRFWMRYIYVLFRRNESEYEDEEMMFPSGRIPFLTIHQSKGLEFPVVILGSPQVSTGQKNRIEELMRELSHRDKNREPLKRIEEFDIMRLFYVALSRAKNLCILTNYTGPGNSSHESVKHLLAHGRKYITQPDVFAMSDLPVAKPGSNAIQRRYSYTTDYLNYQNCARQYMIFRKYDFAPSRTPYQMFGSLIHSTIEEIHSLLIDARTGGQSS